MSMYETGYSPKQYPHRVETGRHEDGVILQPFPTNVSTERPPSAALLGAGVGWVVLLNWNHLLSILTVGIVIFTATNQQGVLVMFWLHVCVLILILHSF